MTRTLGSSQRLAVCGGLLLVLVCLPAARAISCYQCNSFEDPGCSDIKPGNSSYAHLLKPCDGDYNGEEPFCGKMVQTLQRKEPVTRVRRMCSWERSHRPCYMFDDGDHLETVCYCFEDGCNAAASLASLATVTMVGVLAALAAFLRPH